MSTIGRFHLALVIAVAAPAGACVSSGQQVELAGVAPTRQGVRSAAPASVDLLPIETEVATYAGHRHAGRDPGMALRAAVRAALPVALASRRHRLAAVLDRPSRRAPAMAPAELSAARAALLSYQEAQRGSPRTLLTPALPYPLGRATRSRSTLFVAAYGFAGDDATHLDDVVGALAAVTVVAGTAGTVGALASGDADAAAENAAAVDDATATLEEVEYRNQFRAPRSHLRLVVTVVDNETGRVIWHSDREFAGLDPTDPGDVQRAVEKSLRRMPRG